MIYSKKKIIRFILVALTFLVADVWIFSSLVGEFSKIMGASESKEIRLFALTAPKDPAFYEDWVASAQQVLPGSSSIFLTMDAESGEFGLSAGDEPLAQFFEQQKASPVFVKGLESAYYLEPFVTTVPGLAGKFYFCTGSR